MAGRPDSPIGRERYRSYGGWGYGRPDYPVSERYVAHGQRGGAMRRFTGDLARRPGAEPHVGKGPANYAPSDERILESVCEALHEDDWIDATGIVVAVKDGEVRLSGHVPERRMRERAVMLARRAHGTKAVADRVEIRGPAQSR